VWICETARLGVPFRFSGGISATDCANLVAFSYIYD
jgi:hypothetical protein